MTKKWFYVIDVEYDDATFSKILADDISEAEEMIEDRFNNSKTVITEKEANSFAEFVRRESEIK